MSDNLERTEEYYRRGQSEAWNAAVKIALADTAEGLTSEELVRSFGTDSPHLIFKNFSPAFAVEKVRECENARAPIPGDEIIFHASTGDVRRIVLKSDGANQPITALCSDGRAATMYQWNGYVEKTGRRYSVVIDALESLKGGDA